MAHRDEALLDVFNGLKQIVTSRAEELPDAAAAPVPAPQAAAVNAARDFEDLAVRITMDQVAFNVDEGGTAGGPTSAPRRSRAWPTCVTAIPTPTEARCSTRCSAPTSAWRRATSELALASASARVSACAFYIDPAADLLQVLWWEALRDQKPPPRRLATQHGTPLSRFFDGADLEPVRRTRMKLLVVVSDPTGLAPPEWVGLDDYDAAAELATIQTALASLDDRVDFHIHGEAASPLRINDSLRSGQIDVLHLVAPGVDRDGTPGPARPRDGGRPPPRRSGRCRRADRRRRRDASARRPLDRLHLGRILAGRAYFSIAAQLLDYGVPAVLAMHGKVEAETAEVFTQTFYDTLLRSARSTASSMSRRTARGSRSGSVVATRGTGPRPSSSSGARAGSTTRSRRKRRTSILAAIQPGAVAAPPIIREVIPAQPAPRCPLLRLDPSANVEAFHMLTAKYVLTGDEMDRLAWSLGVALEDNGGRPPRGGARAHHRVRPRPGKVFETLIGQITIIVSQRRAQDPALRALHSLTA